MERNEKHIDSLIELWKDVQLAEKHGYKKLNLLKIGETVSWCGSWGNDDPKEAKVVDIQINCKDKYGENVSYIAWSHIRDAHKDWDFAKTIIVGLDNNHWAYADQITQKRSK